MTDEQIIAVLAAFEKLRTDGVGSPWIDERITLYEEEITRRLLLNGARPFQPVADEDGVMIVNELGDREDDL